VEELYQKMLGFTKMTEELPFDEFLAYYQDVMALLQNDYPELSADDLLKAKGILGIVHVNALTRASRKDANRKKFQKMAEKANFWQEAIKARLLKEGMPPSELEEKVAALFADQAEEKEEKAD